MISKNCLRYIKRCLKKETKLKVTLKNITECIENRDSIFFNTQISNIGKDYQKTPVYKYKFIIYNNKYRLIFVDFNDIIIYLFFYDKTMKENVQSSIIREHLDILNTDLDCVEFWSFFKNI